LSAQEVRCGCRHRDLRGAHVVAVETVGGPFRARNESHGSYRGAAPPPVNPRPITRPGDGSSALRSGSAVTSSAGVVLPRTAGATFTGSPTISDALVAFVR